MFSLLAVAVVQSAADGSRVRLVVVYSPAAGTVEWSRTSECSTVQINIHF